jgi:hypothetical protein
MPGFADRIVEEIEAEIRRLQAAGRRARGGVEHAALPLHFKLRSRVIEGVRGAHGQLNEQLIHVTVYE